MTPYRFSLQKIFKKSTFFKFFCIFRISTTSWLEKWSYFWNLINFQFWPFWHFIDLQLLRPTEALSLSIKFHVSLLSHVVEVKYDCNVVIWPYFQSTPNYVQCVQELTEFQNVRKVEKQWIPVQIINQLYFAEMYRNWLSFKLAKLQGYLKPSEFLYFSYSNSESKKPTGIDCVSKDYSVIAKKVSQKHTGIGLLSNFGPTSKWTNVLVFS